MNFDLRGRNHHRPQARLMFYHHSKSESSPANIGLDITDFVHFIAFYQTPEMTFNDL